MSILYWSNTISVFVIELPQTVSKFRKLKMTNDIIFNNNLSILLVFRYINFYNTTALCRHNVEPLCRGHEVCS